MRYGDEDIEQDDIPQYSYEETEPLNEFVAAMRRHPGGAGITEPEAFELMISIFTTTGMIAVSQGRVLKKYKLGGQEVRTLRLLNFEDDRALSMHDISKRIKVSQPHVTKIIDNMERAGLVERIKHPNDRRTTLVHLTEAGLLRLQEASPEVNAVIADLFSPLSAAEKQQLLDMLWRIRSHIAAQRQATPEDVD